MTVTHAQAWTIVAVSSALLILAVFVYRRAGQALKVQRDRAIPEIPTYTAEQIDAMLKAPGIKVISPNPAWDQVSQETPR